MKQETRSYVAACLQAADRSQRETSRLVGMIGQLGDAEQTATELSTVLAGWQFPTPQKKQALKRLFKRHFQARFPTHLLKIKGNHCAAVARAGAVINHNGDVQTDDRPLQSNRQLETANARLARENRELKEAVPEVVTPDQVREALAMADQVAERERLKAQRLDREKAVMADEYAALKAAILDPKITRAQLRAMVA